MGMTFAFTHRAVLEPTIPSFKVIDVEAVARDGKVKGYCAVAGQYMDFTVETKHPVETKVGILSRSNQIRDSRGRFVRGNVPINKRVS